MFCNVVGEWRITYVAGRKHDTKTFNVVDSIAPTFEAASTAYDIWYDAVKDENGNIIDRGSYYELPMIFPSDLSEFDYDTYEMKLVLDTNPYSESNDIINVDIIGDEGFYAPATGKMTYTVAIADIYGNKSEYSMSWNVKDKNWKDENLTENYLADYNKPEYVNSVQSGYMSSYWAKTQLYEEFFTAERFTEKTGIAADSGVLKVSAVPSSDYAVGAFKFKLQHPVSEAELGSKYFVVKFYTPNNVSTVRFGAQSWQESRNIECCHNVVVNVTNDDWSFVVIPTSELKYGYFELGDEAIEFFHIAFGTVGEGVGDELIELYVDSVALAEKFPEISGYKLEGKVLSWDKVEGAYSYEVTQDGVVSVVYDNSCEVIDPDGVITVKALSNDARYVSADYATTFINTTNFGANDLAVFDSNSYLSAVTKSTRTERIANKLEASILKSYEGETNVLKVVTEANSNGIGDFRIKLPKDCTDGITLKFMIKLSGADFFYWINPADGVTHSIDDSANILANKPLGDMAGDWQTVYIPYATSSIKDVIEVLVLDNANHTENMVTEVYFSKVLNGNHTEEIGNEIKKQQIKELANSLKDNDLADFSSADYVNTIDYSSGQKAESITAEYLAEYKNENGVVKVTSKMNGVSWGPVKVVLPKASTSGKVTVKFMVETGVATMWFTKPGTADAVKKIDGSQADISVSDTWQTMTVDYSAVGCDCIEILLANTPNGEAVIYFASITEYVAD